jgi:predicted TIM-barrel fold metal-dependent hydrolase
MTLPTRIFDCHSHWGTRRGYIFRSEAELAQQETIWKTKATFFSDKEMTSYFRYNNVRAILDLSFTKFLPIEEIREHHDYAFSVQRANADVIFGHWLQFDPYRPLEAIREFDRALSANAGFIGLCVNGQVTGVAASDLRWDPFYQLAREANRPIMILTGLTGIGQGLPGGKGIVLDHGHPRHIDEVAARYPNVKILAARPAYPWQDDMLAIMTHKPNVAYELHGWGPRQFTPALKKAIAGRMQDRIMWGCDFPVLRYEKILKDWESEGYSEGVLRKVLAENAADYFGAEP